MQDDREIMAKSFSDTLDLVDLLLSGDFDWSDTERVGEIVRKFRNLLARSNALQDEN